ncbi:unnamed protein product [Rangifer tarandus platyrhynchus]|uniref:Uncharacterized protein n=1 Tax=Rangifer tarandus platyrhynchus TaxID=3082113 RepID=A0ACB1KGU6_RANTA
MRSYSRDKASPKLLRRCACNRVIVTRATTLPRHIGARTLEKCVVRSASEKPVAARSETASVAAPFLTMVYRTQTWNYAKPSAGQAQACTLPQKTGVPQQRAPHHQKAIKGRSGNGRSRDFRLKGHTPTVQTTCARRPPSFRGSPATPAFSSERTTQADDGRDAHDVRRRQPWPGAHQYLWHEARWLAFVYQALLPYHAAAFLSRGVYFLLILVRLFLHRAADNLSSGFRCITPTGRMSVLRVRVHANRQTPRGAVASSAQKTHIAAAACARAGECESAASFIGNLP